MTLLEEWKQTLKCFVYKAETAVYSWNIEEFSAIRKFSFKFSMQTKFFTN